jgi:hypothetical protein
LRQTTEDAVLNANYIRKKLEDLYELPYTTPSMHEVVFSDRRQLRNGVRTGDIAKRLIDYGFHPYTVSFPLIVPGALMIEPTESESREELDLFVDAMRQIAREVEENPQMVLDAPHSTRVSRLDETTAARKPVLRWKKNREWGVGISPQRTQRSQRMLLARVCERTLDHFSSESALFDSQLRTCSQNPALARGFLLCDEIAGLKCSSRGAVVSVKCGRRFR